MVARSAVSGKWLYSGLNSSTKPAVIVICCLWIALAVLVNPVGEFPLNDDWSYSRAVESLVDTGVLQLTGFTSMPLLAQVLWGALFSFPFGFSFTALRISTLVLGLVGILATYSLFKELNGNSLMTVLATLVVALNPLYFSLAFTFMTDVPFFAFSMLACLFLVRSIADDSRANFLAGCLFACAATLIRQAGVVITLSFGIAYIAKKGISRQTWLSALSPTILLFFVLHTYETWLRQTSRVPVLYGVAEGRILAAFSAEMSQTVSLLSKGFLEALLYLGLFALPFLLIAAVADWNSSTTKEKIRLTFALCVICLLLLAAVVSGNRTMPLSGNILFDTGVGPTTLRDEYILDLPHLPRAPKEIWIVITAASVFGAVLLIHYLVRAAATVFMKLVKSRSVAGTWMPILFLTTCALYSILIGITGYFDRYFIFLLPFVMLLALPQRPNALRVNQTSLIIAAILALMYGSFSLAATHDYISWNRSRWEALNYLMGKSHVPQKDIDGGFEFNGWYDYSPTYREQPSKSWWWVENDDYVIAFGSIEGYTEVRHYSYERWLPFGEGNIYVLRKLGGSN